MESDPTPEEIAEACARIQATWSAAEKRRRWVHKTEGWSIPVCKPSRKAAFLYEQSDAQVLNNYLPFSGE